MSMKLPSFGEDEFGECLTIRYTNVAGSITEEQTKFLRGLPVDLMDLVSALFNRGIRVEVVYPKGATPQRFPNCLISVRLSPSEIVQLPLEPPELQ